tara:strand:- start:1371 stop:1571 length:201 start_codon:yes stop_codon:yes gene_type:complete
MVAASPTQLDWIGGGWSPGGGWSHRRASPLVVSRFVTVGARHIFGGFWSLVFFLECVFLDFGGELE